MNRTTLNKATSPDNDPTPGYLFDEIAKVTHDAVANDRLVEYLLKRLDSPIPTVKAKVLNIVKHVCRKGNPAFRRAWQREAGVVKSHLQFHGAPDPLRGDEPSKRVRECAKEALEAIFDASRDEKKGADQNLQGRIQGFGVQAPTPSAAAAAATTGPEYSMTAPPSGGFVSTSNYPAHLGGTGTRYQGIGNPNFQHTPREPRGFVARVAEAVRERVEQRAGSGAQDAPIPGVGGVKPPWMTGGASDAAGYNFASNRGMQAASQSYSSSGGYDPDAVMRTSASAPRPVQQQPWSDPRSPRIVNNNSNQQVVVNSVVSGPRPPARSSTRSDGTHERMLVGELCAPGGVRPFPPKDKLDAFCVACKTLEPDIVLQAIEEKLLEEDWKVQHKALCILEQILQIPSLSSYGDLLDQFFADALELLYNSKHPQVRDRAQRVWNLLYADEQQQSNTNPDQQQQQTNGGVQQQYPEQVDLLDFGKSETQGASNAAAASSFNNATSMFANLSVKSASGGGGGGENNNVQDKNTSSFSFLGAAAPVPAPVPLVATGGGNDMNQTKKPVPAPSMDLLDFPTTSSSQGMPDLFAPMMKPASVPVNSAPPPSSGMMMTMPSAPAKANTSMMFPPAYPAATSGPASSMSNRTAAATGSSTAAKPVVDSFSFVQDALQSTKQ